MAQQQSEREKYIAQLRETLKPGDTLHTVLRSVSRSGMSRCIDVYFLTPDGKGGVQKQWLSYWIARACGFTFQDKRGQAECIKITGCGTDMGFEIVYQLGRVLFPAGFDCAGERCPSNDHANGDRDRTPHRHTGDGGYAFRQEWL